VLKRRQCDERADPLGVLIEVLSALPKRGRPSPSRAGESLARQWISDVGARTCEGSAECSVPIISDN